MQPKIRVLQVIDRLGNAGAEQLQLTLAEGIDRERFDLHICGLRPRPGSVTLPALLALHIPVLVLNQRGSYDVPALWALIRYVRRHHIDIIHTHLLAGDVMGRLAGFLTRRPVVSTIHNTRRDLDLEPWRRQWLERWTARLWCRRLVVVAGLLRTEIAEWFGFPTNRVITIANAVDTTRFTPRPDLDRAAVRRTAGVGEGPLILNVSRLVPQKGHSYLLDAARIVTDHCPDARFLLAGEGPLQDDLAAAVAAHGLQDHVILAGFRPDVADLLAACDVFVLSSLWEGMPVALLEALAAGCPAIATDVGGVREVVQPGRTGLLVPPADAGALAAAILQLIGTPARARALGAAGQAWVRDEFGQATWVRRCEALYTRELGLAS